MEYALGDIGKTSDGSMSISLNPCCDGICSRRPWTTSGVEILESVLILVVMEYALGDYAQNVEENRMVSLNPCCDGICSRSGVKIPASGRTM